MSLYFIYFRSLLINVLVPDMHVIDFPLIYIIKSFQLMLIPITLVHLGTVPWHKLSVNCTLFHIYFNKSIKLYICYFKSITKCKL